MSENVNFYQGSKKNYNPSEMQGGLYFSKDSKEILLNGESYGNAMEVKDWVNEQGFARVSDIPEGLEIGETTGTAFDGGRGKAIEDKISNLPYLVIGYNSFTENEDLPNFHSEINNNPDKENTLNNILKLGKFYPKLSCGFYSFLENYCDMPNREELKLRNRIIFNISDEQDFSKAIISYISGMTDNFAMEMYNEIIRF